MSTEGGQATRMLRVDAEDLHRYCHTQEGMGVGLALHGGEQSTSNGFQYCYFNIPVNVWQKVDGCKFDSSSFSCVP
jgi:hypothetical protein